MNDLGEHSEANHFPATFVAAERYAKLGWCIFPVHTIAAGRCTCGRANCNSPGKHPRSEHGCKDATTDLDRLRRWGERWSRSNVAVATGRASGLVVVDIDDESAFESLEQEYGRLPTTVEQRTGRGRQLFFRYPADGIVRNKTGLGGRRGVDVRGAGGYVVIPPSQHINGTEYAWQEGSDPTNGARPTALPSAWLKLLSGPADAETQPAPIATADVLEHGQRNDGLFRIAASMRARGLSSKAIEAALLAENRTRCRPPLGDQEVQAIAKSVARYAPGQDENSKAPDVWPEPQPLPNELPPVQSFDFELLPASLRPWIRDIADRVQCPPDFPAVAAIIALAAVVGRKIGIRPKRQDDWLVVPNLWGAGIGPPSVMKTPAIQEPLRPLKLLEIEAKRAFDNAMQEFQAQQFVAEQRRAAAKTAVRRALADTDGDAVAVAREALSQENSPPIRRRYMVNDSTVEKLGELLNENPNGVLCYRDELIGLLKSLDKEGQEGARSFYLEAWTGTGRYTYDRIGRGTIDIEAAIVSLLGSIQPGPLRSYLRGAVSGGEGADGLMQRFQLAVYPDVPKKWRNIDRWPDGEAKRDAYGAIRTLDRLDPRLVGAEPDHEDGIPFLRFDPKAQERFDDWRAALEHRLRAGDEHEVIVAHLAKFRSLIPSLALLCHLAEGNTGSVGLDSLERAIAWGEYLESHARRIYAVAIAPDIGEAVALAQKIRAGKLPEEFAIRDVYRHGWIDLNSAEAVERAVRMLMDLDWLTQVEEPTATRPRIRYLVNPRVRKNDSERTDKTDKSL